ncbi:nitrite reductase large subunit NirB [Vibrio europaeus]|uniref:Nitrite reductase large subunit n=1 Tax=Vibrio europaeus TaxID=300876 RepID=A0AAE7B0K7_9VIBR|nr:nitrite reductase large subunit NirB [Vibrio europaeus]MDC5806144.1 nitrite reductase large subunit NirB [Vibrio europaeus]MDC5825573.1 nitrite reductase large subunit NirB [Vibrio europaeus]MDC5831147.1 nitrite reductase large subunit NirB [Vibrio europaeus]MDC5834103.1 nitrite reductase large subunit NirB [Vibrio europaeus]QJY38851.1 nitrite reductase large subunit [Vibrio europaeus]
MEHVVIVGNGMVGHHLVAQLVERGAHLEKRITVIGEERFIAYDRVQLSSLFSGNSHQDLMLSSEEWYGKHGIELMLGSQVTKIERDNKRLVLDEDSVIGYDQLVLATGSYPFVPPIEGHDRDNIFVYRTLDDLSEIKTACQGAKTGAVIGGGLLGLEAANALKLLGVETHVVEFAPRLMPVQLDDGAGLVLKEKIEELGLTVHTSTATEKICDGEGATHRMVFKGADPLEVDVIVFSAGIRPQDALARQAGINIGERGGIVVDDQCRTSDESIFAIGECALWQEKIFGLVAPGYTMARVVADKLVGREKAGFTGADMSTKLKLLGVDVASIGDAHKATDGAQEMVLQDAVAGVYKKLVVDQSGTKLLGAILVGDNSDYDALLQCYLNETTLPDHAANLLFDTGMLNGEMADTAIICSCHNVSKGDLVNAIQAGAHDLDTLKAETKAGTGCGGCSNMVKSVLDAQLTAMGVEVNNHICEHFELSRQELFHICQVEEIKDFDTLIEKHGKGHGCDLCKPTAASVFASLWNEHIMEPQHSSLQDSNDAFMANLQKDGSYSVVPRVAGGEITPDKLIALGEVAKKYDLYTKITGGQRVDLFGAQVEQLPDIWQALIDAGFETGHAYGKSLRTVKSCVGSTWCRYGVDDSVGLAIELENRYKGLRAPHKIKFAVSGCTRECAEAQSKDIGVIATENGWNLYVCGNGGMRPRHADLIASDLSKAELVALIDRVLMFYVRTADRLQRTSVWMENLEGGLDYLKQVVIEDSLSIADSLEDQMKHVVDTYQCEWKSTLENSDKLVKFKPFINAEEASQVLPYQRVRGQRIPVKEEV